jgi:hypothetical protein
VAIRSGRADDSTELGNLIDALEPEALRRDLADRTGEYSHWFAEAEAVEADLVSPLTDAAALAACHEPGAAGFEARRLLPPARNRVPRGAPTSPARLDIALADLGVTNRSRRCDPWGA